MKRNVIYLLTLLIIVANACLSSKNDDPELIIDPPFENLYKGVMSVVYQDQTYPNDSIAVSLSLNAANDSVDIQINQIRFVPSMPVTIDLIVPSVPCTVRQDGSVTFAGTGIVPVMLNGAAYPMYTVTDLQGSADSGQCVFSLNFGSFPTSYTGQRLH